MSLQRKLEVLSAAVVLSAAAGPAAAADFGLGAAFTNGGFGTGTTIMVPIRLEGWLIEPQVADSSNKVGGVKTVSHQPGVGVYMNKNVGPGYEMYYGGIIGYSASKTTGVGPEVKTTSLILQPTVGLAHYFSKQFSLGVDVGLNYQDGTIKTSGAADQDVRNWSTVARIIARMYF